MEVQATDRHYCTIDLLRVSVMKYQNNQHTLELQNKIPKLYKRFHNLKLSSYVDDIILAVCIHI